MAARFAEVVVPVRAVQGDPRAGEETAPRHAGQVVEIRLGVAVVGHVDGRAFVIGLVFAARGFGTPRAAGAARPQDEAFVLESHQGLRGEVHIDGLQGVGNVGRKRGQLPVRDEADVPRVEVEILAQVVVVDAIPDAPVRFVDVDRRHPMRRAVEGAKGTVGVEAEAAAHVREGDGDLAEGLLALQPRDGRLQFGADGLDVGRVDEAVRQPIPDAVVVALACQLGLDVEDLVLADQFDLLRFERGGLVQRDAADGGASLKTDGRFGEGFVEAQLGQRERQEARAAQFKKVASGKGHF